MATCIYNMILLYILLCTISAHWKRRRFWGTNDKEDVYNSDNDDFYYGIGDLLHDDVDDRYVGFIKKS